MQAQTTAERTCSATHTSAQAHAEAYFERVRHCLSQIALLGAGLPANDPQGNYVFSYFSPTGHVCGRRAGSSIAQVAAIVAAGEFECRQVKATAPARRGRQPAALFLEVDGYVVQVLPASSDEGRRLLARQDLAAMAAAHLRLPNDRSAEGVA